MGTVKVQITIQVNDEIHKSSIVSLLLDEPENKDKRNQLLYMLAEDLNKKIAEKRVILDKGGKLVVFSPKNYENMIGWVELVS